MAESTPTLSLEVRINQATELPTLLGLCAGYELGQWRCSEFARDLLRHLYQFIFPTSSWGAVNSATAMDMLVDAADALYKTPKYENRGEIGELMLFAILRAHYGSLPIISKLYFKTADNDTVKGFDAVHFVMGPSGLELWLGEVKFYKSITKAINDVVLELEDHLKANYLRSEFAWVGKKMASGDPHYEEINELLNKNTSLDKIFPVLHIPVLLTYESPAVKANSIVDDKYLAEIESELTKNLAQFKSKCPIDKVVIHLILVPMKAKSELVQKFDAHLKALQAINGATP